MTIQVLITCLTPLPLIFYSDINATVMVMTRQVVGCTNDSDHSASRLHYSRLYTCVLLHVYTLQCMNRQTVEGHSQSLELVTHIQSPDTGNEPCLLTVNNTSKQ